VKAVIMAGGEGTRLRPLTSTRPKPMVPIVNQPVMEHILGLVKHHGMTEVVATLAFMPRVIQEYFGDGDEWGMSISYAIEETPLGTAGSVKNAESLLNDGPFIVISGDAVTDFDLTEAARFHASHDGPVTIVLTRVPDPSDFGVVITADDGRIERFLEKPTWGQVFSDTINTGIYVIDPLVFDFIPAEGASDFSSDVFPALMEAGHNLYGFIAEGYWCDVGSLESYMDAHRDILDGLAKVYVPGTHARDDVWIGKGAAIDPTAELGSKVVIGENVRVRAGAHIGDYSVIGDNCLVSDGATVERSILWDDAYLGALSDTRGAILCRGVDVRSRARIEQGVAIGDDTVVGRGAQVATDVLVYPSKRIEAGALITKPIIWESTGQRSVFGADGIAGVVNIDVTPDVALRIAQAFASTLPPKTHIAVSRDTSRAARMLSRAIAAGLNSTGNIVRDLRVASPAVTRFTARDTRCSGGMHVCASSTDPQWVEIHFFDADGLDIAPWEEKKVERLYFRLEFRRAFFEDIGEILYPSRAFEYYGAGMIEALGGRPVTRAHPTVVVDLAYSSASAVLPHVGAGWNVDLVSLRPFADTEATRLQAALRDEEIGRLAKAVDAFQATLGLAMDASAERVTIVTESGRVLDPDTLLHAMILLWCSTDTTERSLAVPMTASRVIEGIAARYGREVIRAGTTRRALSAATLLPGVGFAGSRTGGFVFPDFLASYDAVMTLGMLLHALDATNVGLDELVDALPPFSLRHRAVFCPFDRKGAVMRQMAEYGQSRDAEMTEGVRVNEEAGWALVLPHASEALVDVYVEGDDDDAADEIADRYGALVEHAIAED
jgi:mannose-1-phosphate guanylyltransferase/phosphomannomutase